MKCSYVEIEVDGHPVRAIVCGGRYYGESTRKCKTCGAPATRLCDWILERPRGALAGAIQVSSLDTCDEPCCTACARRQKGGKDLCPTHASVWETDPRNKTPELRLDGETMSDALASATTSTKFRR